MQFFRGSLFARVGHHLLEGQLGVGQVGEAGAVDLRNGASNWRRAVEVAVNVCRSEASSDAALNAPKSGSD